MTLAGLECGDLALAQREGRALTTVLSTADEGLKAKLSRHYTRYRTLHRLRNAIKKAQASSAAAATDDGDGVESGVEEAPSADDGSAGHESDGSEAGGGVGGDVPADGGGKAADWMDGALEAIAAFD